MGSAYATTRGSAGSPQLLEIDLDCGEMIGSFEYQELANEYVPDTKNGFAGIAADSTTITACTWDKICTIDIFTKEVISIISSNFFSDLHGLCRDPDGSVWVASTNLDGVYTVRGAEVEPFWHVWDRSRGHTAPLADIDYRRLTKNSIPYYNAHINSVFTLGDCVFVSYLGPMKQRGKLRCLLEGIGAIRRKVRHGGVYILDRHSGRIKRKISAEGLHDPCLVGGKYLYYPEYHGDALVRLDTETFGWRRIKLDHADNGSSNRLLARGLFADDCFWVGYTVHRSCWDTGANAQIRRYDLEGNFLGDRIELPGIKGIYQIVEATERSRFTGQTVVF